MMMMRTWKYLTPIPAFHLYRIRQMSLSLTDNDSSNETDDVHIERAGVYDTLFTSPDFVEPSERQCSYGHINGGHCDKVYSFAPAEYNKPVSILLDVHAEELAVPNIFGAVHAQRFIL